MYPEGMRRFQRIVRFNSGKLRKPEFQGWEEKKQIWKAGKIGNLGLRSRKTIKIQREKSIDAIHPPRKTTSTRPRQAVRNLQRSGYYGGEGGGIIGKCMKQKRDQNQLSVGWQHTGVENKTKPRPVASAAPHPITPAYVNLEYLWNKKARINSGAGVWGCVKRLRIWRDTL